MGAGGREARMVVGGLVAALPVEVLGVVIWGAGVMVPASRGWVVEVDMAPGLRALGGAADMGQATEVAEQVAEGKAMVVI